MKLKNFGLEVGSRIFKAFSEEARVRILYLLWRNEKMCIADLEFVLDFTQTKTSRHLSFLKNSGLVYADKVDAWSFYRIKDEVSDIVKQLFVFLEKDPILQADYEMYRTLYSNRELAINKIEAKKNNRYKAQDYAPKH